MFSVVSAETTPTSPTFRKSRPLATSWVPTRMSVFPWEKAFRKAVYTRDGGKGCHPDHNGHKLITPYIVEFIGSLLAE